MKPKDEAKEFVRVGWKRGLDDALPYGVRALMSAYAMSKRSSYYYEVPLGAPSANKMYSKQFKRDGRMTFWMDPAVKAFREMTIAATIGRKYSPRGVLAAILIHESPAWITKESAIRRKDVDNPVKCVLDAMQGAIGLVDEKLWEVHTAKMVSSRECVHVWLYELGDAITGIKGGVINASYRG